MKKLRAFSRYTLLATDLLGKQIQLARKQRKWSERELAERAGISRATLQKIEKGDPYCSLGLAFEVAALVEVELFTSDIILMKEQIKWADQILALLPKKIRKTTPILNDNF